MRTLCWLFFMLFCATSLRAEKLSILTELEQLQEKIWYLQRDLGTNRTALEEQQRQLGVLASGIAGDRQEQNERLDALAQANSAQQEGLQRMETAVEKIAVSLAALASEVSQQNLIMQERAGKISSLENTLTALKGEFAALQAGTGQALGELRSQTAATRSRLDALDQDVGGQFRQIGYWGAGAALFLAVAMTIGIAFRKHNPGSRR